MRLRILLRCVHRKLLISFIVALARKLLRQGPMRRKKAAGNRKLKLKKESRRQLDGGALGQVAGGTFGGGVADAPGIEMPLETGNPLVIRIYPTKYC